MLNLRPCFLVTAGVLVTAGCAHSKTASRPATSDELTVEVTPSASQSVDDQSESAPLQEAEFAVEQTAHEVSASGTLPTPAPPMHGWLTLDSLEQMALSSNPTLVESRARVDAASGRWLQVGLKPNPQIGYTAPEIGNEGTAGQ